MLAAACALFIVLWARSYWWYECIQLGNSLVTISVSTGRGKMLYEASRPPTATALHWHYFSHPVVPGGLMSGKQFFEMLYLSGENPYFIQLGLTSSIIPFWLLASLTAFLAPLSWLRWRFTLRTLLIATTLIAVVLGLAVYAARK